MCKSAFTHINLVGGDAKIGENADAQNRWADIKSGVLQKASVGYSVDQMVLEEEKKDGPSTYRVTSWTPFEGSLVTIPADFSVGVGRSDERGGEKDISCALTINVDEQPNIVQKATQQTRTMPEATTTPAVTIDPASERNAAVAEFKTRCKRIDEFVGSLKNPQWQKAASEIAIKHKTGEANFDDFRTEALDSFEGVTRVAAADPGIGMTQRDLGSYSLVRALNDAAKGKLGGLEKEVSDTVAKLTGRETQGFFIPQDVMAHRATRALTTNSFTAAGAFVETGAQGQSMIELLRNQMCVVAMGAKTISGLKGNLAIPSQTGGATAAWLSESGTITASDQAVGQVSLTPHRLAAATAFTFQLLAQSTEDVESFVREDIMRVLAIAKDLAALKGTGVSGQPLGIYGTPNKSTSVTLAGANSMIYADAVNFETNVATNNALQGSLGYLTSIATRGNSKLVAEISAANSIPVWKNDMVNGYKALATNQLTTLPSVIFGNWSDLIIADWGPGGNEVIVDPYSLSMQGQVRIVVQHLTDVAIRHAKSFSISTT